MKRFEFKGITIFYDEAIEDKEKKPRILVTGFRGFGLVGYISVLHLVNSLNCSRVGYIVTRYMPEAISPGKDRIAAPFELFHCTTSKFDAIILVNHEIPDDRERTRYAEAVIRWAKSIGVDELYLVGGFDSRFKQGDEKLRWLCTSKCVRSLSEPKMSEGLYVIGPLALFILFSEIYELPAIVVLPYTDTSRPDHRAAAVAVEAFSRIYGVKVDVSELYEEAKKVEEIIAIMEKQREAMTATSERVYM